MPEICDHGISLDDNVLIGPDGVSMGLVGILWIPVSCDHGMSMGVGDIGEETSLVLGSPILAALETCDCASASVSVGYPGEVSGLNDADSCDHAAI